MSGRHRDTSPSFSTASGWRLPVALSLALSIVFIARTAFMVDGRIAFSLFDDAMISLTYARNLADGFGLRWNPGQPAVEGFSNPLWVLWMTVPELLRVDDLHAPLFVSASGAVILMALVWTTWQLAAAISSGSRAVATVAALTVSLCYPLVFWTLRGMEVGLLALVIHLAMLLVFRLEDSARPARREVSALVALLALAPSIRLDAMIPVAIILLYVSRTFRAADRRAALVACWLAPLAAVLAQTGLRVWYYGAWLPNTYYLKVGGSTIAERWRRGAENLGIHMIRELLAPIGLAVLSPTARSRRGALLAAIVAGQSLYSVSVGGDSWDWMGYANRFVSVALPSLLILASSAIVSSERSRALAGGTTVALALGLAGVILPANARAGFRGAFQSIAQETELIVRLALFGLALAWAIRGAFAAVAALRRPMAEMALPPRWVTAARAIGLIVAVAGGGASAWWSYGPWLAGGDAMMTRVGIVVRQHSAQDASIAVTWAGAIPYYAHRTAVDLLGKNDSFVARSPSHWFVPGHSKWDFDYSIGRLRPDMILQLPAQAGIDIDKLAGWGYRPLPLTARALWFDVFVRADSQRIDRAGLSAALDGIFDSGVAPPATSAAAAVTTSR